MQHPPTTALAPPGHLLAIARQEGFLLVSLATCLAFLWFGETMFAVDRDRPLMLAVVFVWLFAAILGSALAVVRHADHLADLLGEPLGTLILTLSVTAIEVVSISAIMLHGENNPTLVRDTLVAVIMIIMNGMVGLSLLVGALKHREQHYNLQGANTYLGVIIPLAVMALVLPNFTVTTPGPTLALGQQRFLSIMAVGLYIAFLTVQTGRHKGYFTLGAEDEATPHKEKPHGSRSVAYHAAMLGAFMLPVVYLAEQMAKPVDVAIETMHVPVALGGVAIAILVATPEAVGAVRSAVSNHMQRSVNIFLGSVLSTIGLTVPAMLAMSHWTGRHIVLGAEHAEFIMILLTLAVSVVTFASGRTNMLQGIVHLLLFLAFVMLVFEG
jgi:Ca2+:H+ antiporter